MRSHTKLRTDARRPAYHFVAPGGWLNDANGVSQRDGVFHLFYQYNPDGAYHRKIQWGHARSLDLVHWEDRPIALSPDKDGPDRDGCWSGVLVEGDDGPVLVYSGRDSTQATEVTCLAFGDDSMDVWRKYDGNPVISGPPHGVEVTAFRDHCVWREAGVWRQVIGSGIKGVGGCAFLYESDDLITWRELGPLAVGDETAPARHDELWTGTMWECADFFRLREDGTTGPPDAESDDRHVLIFSAWDHGKTLHSMAATGRYRDGHFDIDRYQRLDLGGCYAYAPQSFIDEQGRRIVWAWMQEGRGLWQQVLSGWSGAMALPRRVWLDAQDVVRQEPVDEIEALRDEELRWAHADETWSTEGAQLELGFDVQLARGSRTIWELFSSPDGRERTVVELARNTDGELRLTLDRGHSSRSRGLDVTGREGHVPWDGAVIPVRIFLDRSSIEVFVAGIALTARVYPRDRDAKRVRLHAGGGVVLADVRGWRLAGTEQRRRVRKPKL